MNASERAERMNGIENQCAVEEGAALVAEHDAPECRVCGSTQKEKLLPPCSDENEDGQPTPWE